MVHFSTSLLLLLTFVESALCQNCNQYAASMNDVANYVFHQKNPNYSPMFPPVLNANDSVTVDVLFNFYGISDVVGTKTKNRTISSFYFPLQD